MLDMTVTYHPAQGGPPQILARLTIINDGTASDGSGDAPIGNYDVVQQNGTGAQPQETRVERFRRARRWRALLLEALCRLEEEQP